MPTHSFSGVTCDLIAGLRAEGKREDADKLLKSHQQKIRLARTMDLKRVQQQ